MTKNYSSNAIHISTLICHYLEMIKVPSVEIVARNVKSLMLERNISARALAKKAKHISDRMIGMLISSDREHEITLSKLDAIAKGLEVTPNDLLNQHLIQMLPIKDEIKKIGEYYMLADKDGRKLLMDLAKQMASYSINSLPDYPFGDIELPQKPATRTARKKRQTK